MNTHTRLITAVFLALMSPMGATAQVSSTDSYMAEAAIMSAGSRATAIAAVHHVPSLGVVKLDFRTVPRLRNDSVPDVSEFRILSAKNHAGIKRLRAALAANPATRRALAAHGVAIGRVVGVNVASNGSLRVFVIKAGY
jgi:hypothetical protein